VAIVRKFQGWDRLALPTAVEILARDWLAGGGQGPLDLRGSHVVVPTRHAGRRLRAELARLAAEHGTAVLVGAIVTPEHLVPPPADAAPEALALTLLAQRLLAGRDRLRALFPGASPEWDFAFALGLAAQLQDVRRQLAEADLSAAELLPRVPDEEKDRWADVAQLEKELLQDLRRRGRTDPFQGRRSAARQAPAAAPGARVISLFVPDFSALAKRALATWSAAGGDVELHVLAPASEAERFDAWGRPVPDRWENEPLPLDESQIHVFEQAPDETETLAQLLLAADREGRALAVCMPDADNARALARRLQAENRPLYLPNGVPLAATAPGRLLAAWLALLRRRDYAATAAFLRHPDAQDWLRRRLDLADPAAWLVPLDECQARHLPTTFDDLLRFARRHERHADLARALAELQTHFEDSLPTFLAELHDGRRLAPDAPPDPLFAEAARGLADLLQTAERAAQEAQLGPNAARDLLLAELARAQVFPRPAAAGVRETTGWLEAQWETGPALVLADMREGIVPETRVGDAFLPDALRARAGIAGNREAFARDLFLARALLASRPAAGVRFLYSRRAANQDPQLPSRLLFACPDDELPARVACLFERPAARSAASAAPAPAVWRLRPPPADPARLPQKLSVTAFKAYLDCPFRFYLARVLGMEPADDGAREIDPAGFGTLAHEALATLAAAPELADEAQLAVRLLAELDRRAQNRFGARPPFAVVVQLDSLRQRLVAAARVHAESVRAGWRIVAVEEPFAVPFHGLQLVGRIDRIARHADGRLRILDYKTADGGQRPLETHYQPRLKKWIDLQLPLYRHVHEQLHPDAGPVAVGYFNLPKAVAETAIAEMDFAAKSGEDLYAAALARAREVVAAIQAGVFWPPAEKRADRDVFALLFGADPPLIEELRAP